MYRWKIVGKDGIEMAQCLFEVTGARVTTLPPERVGVERIGEPLTFPTRQQAVWLIEILKLTTILEFHEAEPVAVERLSPFG